MAHPPSSPLPLAEHQAYSWVTRITGAPLSTEAQAEFAVWLQLDPSHADHFDAASRIWELAAQADQHALMRLSELTPHALGDVAEFGVSAEVGTSAIEAEQPQKTGSVDKFNPHPGLLGQSARLGTWLLVLLISSVWFSPSAFQRHVTATGEYQRLTLTDGSVLHLNTDTRVNLNFTATSRAIQLIGGELFIEVAHDPQRPLHVQTRDFKATAIGTAFGVAATREQQWVHVAHGKVAVSERSADKAGASTVNLTQGQKVASGTAGLEPPSYLNQSVAVWRQGQLLYRNVALGELLSDLNRYHANQLVVHNPSLRATRVSAVLNTHSFADAEAALSTSLGLVSYPLSPNVAVLDYPRR